MKIKPQNILCCLLAIFAVNCLSAQPKGGKNIINFKKLQHYNYEKENGQITAQKEAELWQTQLTVTTETQPDFIYNLAAKIPIWPTKIEAGEILLLQFDAKTNFSNLETGEAKSLWILSISDDPKEKIRKTVSIGSQWQTYYVPIQLEQNVKPKDLNLTLQFGFKRQEFLLKNLKLKKYSKNTRLEDLPKTKITYAGMEADADWRKTALQRIEKHRKGDFEIRFTQNGQPVRGLPVQITLKKHHFDWGAAVSAKKMERNPEQFEHLKKAFNLVVFENDLKIKFYERRIPKTTIFAAIDKFQKAAMAMKGHVLVWPGFRHLTPEFYKNRKDPQRLKMMIDEHLQEILTDTKGKISRWDVVNEAYTNTDLQEITGSEEILYDAFRKTKEFAPDALRFTNEYGIISKGGIDTKKQQWYYDYIKRLDENTGGLVDGIGIQCHIGSDLTPPEKVIGLLNYYGELNKKISISEFTLDIDDEEIRTQYTRDFMIAAFSHPQVSEFLFWDFQNEKADIFTENWTYGSMGKAFFDLVHDKWKTDLKKTLNMEGIVEGRGFFGEYEYQYYVGGRVLRGRFSVLPGEKTVVNVELP